MNFLLFLLCARAGHCRVRKKEQDCELDRYEKHFEIGESHFWSPSSSSSSFADIGGETAGHEVKQKLKKKLQLKMSFFPFCLRTLVKKSGDLLKEANTFPAASEDAPLDFLGLRTHSEEAPASAQPPASGLEWKRKYRRRNRPK